MIRHFFALFLFSTCILQSTKACSCAPQLMSIAKILNHDAVFLGKVIDNTIIENPSSQDNSFFKELRRITFVIKDDIRGVEKLDTVNVLTPTQGSACGVNYGLNEVVYIFAGLFEGRYHTDLCSGNRKRALSTSNFRKVIRKYRCANDGNVFQDESGKLAAKGRMINGRAEGRWVFFGSNERVTLQGQFLEGLREGTWVYYRWRTSEELGDSDLLKREVWKIEEFRHGVRVNREFVK